MLRAGVGLAALALAVPAMAQTQPQTQPAGESVTPGPEAVAKPDSLPDNAITVTGSRLRRDTYSSVEPVTVITKEEITLSGFNGSVDALPSNEVTQGAA